ncbi:hypothetical protein EV2_038978 [Malus domestica]
MLSLLPSFVLLLLVNNPCSPWPNLCSLMARSTLLPSRPINLVIGILAMVATTSAYVAAGDIVVTLLPVVGSPTNRVKPNNQQGILGARPSF